jgi:hypothetical protein
MGFDGFDSVELLMDVEDIFGIAIPDREAEKIHTPGELQAYIVQRVGALPDGPSSRCASAAAFYRARRLLVDAFGFDRNSIRPTTPIAQFLPIDHRYRQVAWKRLGDVLQVRLGRLEHPRWMQNLGLSIGFLLFVSACVWAPALARHGIGGAASIVATVALGAAAFLVPAAFFWATRPWAVYLPRRYETVGDVSSVLIGPEVDLLRRKGGGWTMHEVWEIIRWSSAKSACIPPSGIKTDTEFVRL